MRMSKHIISKENLTMKSTRWKLTTLIFAIGLALALGLGVPAHAQAPSSVTLLNVSYDPTRELWRDINANFIARYEKEKGSS